MTAQAPPATRFAPTLPPPWRSRRCLLAGLPRCHGGRSRHPHHRGSQIQPRARGGQRRRGGGRSWPQRRGGCAPPPQRGGDHAPPVGGQGRGRGGEGQRGGEPPPPIGRPSLCLPGAPLLTEAEAVLGEGEGRRRRGEGVAASEGGAQKEDAAGGSGGC
ncbi:hypothetical protein DAI22_03g006000 [Oryza sativa Japonica Group]|nr:hypothetical protein DAI22_03g006000 [Oryza sativa Japonica Group]